MDYDKHSVFDANDMNYSKDDAKNNNSNPSYYNSDDSMPMNPNTKDPSDKNDKDGTIYSSTMDNNCRKRCSK